MVEYPLMHPDELFLGVLRARPAEDTDAQRQVLLRQGIEPWLCAAHRLGQAASVLTTASDPLLASPKLNLTRK